LPLTKRVPEKHTRLNKGKVKWYSETKGFGFIETEDGKSIFVHRAGLLSPVRGLYEGQDVSFDIRSGERNDVAYNVE